MPVRNSGPLNSSVFMWACAVQKMKPLARAAAAIEMPLAAVPVDMNQTSTSRSKISLNVFVTDAVSGSPP